MWTFLITFLVVISVLLVLFILIQEKGVGLSLTFGGQGNVFSSQRGASKRLSYATTAAAILFLVLSFIFVLASPRMAPAPIGDESIPTPSGIPTVEVEGEAVEDGKLDLDIEDFEVVETEQGAFELTPKTTEE